MTEENVQITKGYSARSALGNLIIACIDADITSVTTVVGKPGMPNVDHVFRMADAILFETHDDGLLEIRCLSIGMDEAYLLISQISPRPGIAAGFVDQDITNTHFVDFELSRIVDSIEQLKKALRDQMDATEQQFEYISGKLDEMQEASSRLGRKDWMNHAVGILTSSVAGAALNSEASRTLFRAASASMSWLFGDGLRMLE